MDIEVRLFGALRDRAPGDTVRVEVAEGATVADVQRALARVLGTALVHDAAIANDEEVLGPEAAVRPGDRLAALPPVCGG